MNNFIWIVKLLYLSVSSHFNWQYSLVYSLLFIGLKKKKSSSYLIIVNMSPISRIFPQSPKNCACSSSYKEGFLRQRNLQKLQTNHKFEVSWKYNWKNSVKQDNRYLFVIRSMSTSGTASALLRVNNDILTAVDNGIITALILLDLSAAFDTVEHNILISWLHNYLGIQDQALKWCKSNLSKRPQYVRIGTATSHPTVLDYSVPQGSVLGSQWFTVYTYPVRDIILRHDLNYHVYDQALFVI